MFSVTRSRGEVLSALGHDERVRKKDLEALIAQNRGMMWIMWSVQ